MTVANKLLQVYKKTGVMSKDGKISSGGGSYGFLSEDKVTATLHPIFAEVGLVIIPVKMEPLNYREDTTKSGNVMHNAVIQTTFALIDPDDGDRVEGMALGEGSDTGDKTLNKCMTAAYKYFLLETCMISTGDDPDHHASAESASSRQQQPARQAAPRPAATSASGEPTATMRDWFQAMERAGLMVPDPERGPDKQKPAGEWYHLAERYQLPRSWSKMTPEEYGRAVAICNSYKPAEPAREPEASGDLYPDASGIQGDPFADAG